MALAYATADIAAIADDDVRYLDGCAKTIVDTHKAHPCDAIITFQVNDDKNIPPRKNFEQI